MDGRRGFVRQTLGLLGASALGVGLPERSRASDQTVHDWVASPPLGFSPLQRPGVVVKAECRGDFASMMQPNLLWPKPEVGRRVLESALTAFTGEASLPRALGRFVHPSDRVALKLNGIAGQRGYTMAFNFELTLPLIEGLMSLGVPAENITIFEQRYSFLRGGRITIDGYELPHGVKIGVHNNHDAEMSPIAIYNGIPTRFVRQVTQASAIIDLTMMKDHSICGFTGALKNMTHGQIVNPHDHHAHQCNPQIAMIYNHPILTSRVRLHISDAFKIIYEGGPLDTDPARRVPHGAVYVATDPVALDTVGTQVIETERREHGLPGLAAVGREPAYVRSAGELGLGVHDLNQIRLQSVTV